MKEWRECRIAWIGGEEGEQHGWYYASVGRTYLGLLEQCNPGLSDIRRSITLPDGATIHVGRVGGIRFIKIDIREVEEGSDSLYMESGFIGLGEDHPAQAAGDNVDGTYIENAVTDQLEALKSQDVLAVTEPDGGVPIHGLLNYKRPKSFTLPVSSAGVADATRTGQLRAKNEAALYPRASMFTGRMRLFIQAKLGRRLSETQITADANRLFWNGRELGWSQTMTSGLMYDEALKTYFIIDHHASGQVRATRLLIPGRRGKILKQIWDATTDPTTKRVVEAYILCLATIDRTYQDVLIASSEGLVLAGNTLYYGIKFDWSGQNAAVVAHEFHATETKNRSTLYRFEFHVDTNTAGQLVWTVIRAQQEQQLWYSHLFALWYPSADGYIHADPQWAGGFGSVSVCTVPITCYYDAMDGLVIARYSLTDHSYRTNQISNDVLDRTTPVNSAIACGGSGYAEISSNAGWFNAATLSVGGASLSTSAQAGRDLHWVKHESATDLTSDVLTFGQGTFYSVCGGDEDLFELYDNFKGYAKARGGSEMTGETRDYSQYLEDMTHFALIPFHCADVVAIGQVAALVEAYSFTRIKTTGQMVYAQPYRRLDNPTRFEPLGGFVRVRTQNSPSEFPQLYDAQETENLAGNEQQVTYDIKVRVVSPASSLSVVTHNASGPTASAAIGPYPDLLNYFYPTLQEREVGIGEHPYAYEAMNGEIRAQVKASLPEVSTGFPSEPGRNVVSIGWR